MRAYICHFASKTIDIDRSLPGNNREYLVMFLGVESDPSTERAFSQFGIFGR